MERSMTKSESQTIEPRAWFALPADRSVAGARIESAGDALARYGLVAVVAWIGAMKFTAYEASAIEPLVATSPVLAWVYDVWTVREFSAVLGLVELAIAGLLAVEHCWPRLAALGGAMAVGMFATTLSFLLSAPGWEPSLGFPALAVVPGQFLLKDLVLLGVAVRVLGRALRTLH